MDEPKTRRIRLEHDGDPRGHNLRVLDAETGEPIRWVTRVEFVATANGKISATLFIDAPEMDMTVDARIDVLSAEQRIAALVLAQLAPQLERIERALANHDRGPTIGPFLGGE